MAGFLFVLLFKECTLTESSISKILGLCSVSYASTKINLYMSIYIYAFFLLELFQHAGNASQGLQHCRSSENVVSLGNRYILGL